MNIIKEKVLALLLIVIIVLQGCGPLSSVSGDQSKTYKQDFDTMVNTVEKAIRGRSLVVNFSQKSDDGN